jgi:nucleotide-binding universal stress UspA family protein
MLASKLQKLNQLREQKKERQKLAEEVLRQEEFNHKEIIPTIIACIDITNASSAVLKYACYKAKKRSFGVQILAVMEASHRDLLFVSRTMAKQKRLVLEKQLNKLIADIYEETGVTPSVSIKEGDIVTELIKEIEATPSCTMLVFGKTQNSFSDNTVLPKISKQIGTKIKVPVVIVPPNLSNEYFQELL